MNVGFEGHLKGAGGRFYIHRWLPEDGWLKQACEPGTLADKKVVQECSPSQAHPRCPRCFEGGA
jgi:hypothetical protein